MFGRRSKRAEDPLLSAPPTADLESLGGQSEPSPLRPSELGSNESDFARHFAQAGSTFDDFFDGDTSHDPDNQITRDLR